MSRYHKVASAEKSAKKSDKEIYDHSHVWSGLSYNSIFTYEKSDMFRPIYTYGCQTSDQQTFQTDYGGKSTFKNVYSSVNNNNRGFENGRLSGSGSEMENDRERVERAISPFIELVLTMLSYLALIITAPVSLFFSLKVIKENEELVLFRLGHVQEPKKQGVILILPCIDSFNLIDLQEQTFAITPIQTLTKDKAIVEIGAKVCFKVYNSLQFVTSVEDFGEIGRATGHDLLKKEVNLRYADDFTSKRRYIEEDVKKSLHSITVGWGVEISKFELHQVKIMRKPPPPSHNFLKSLMQPQIASAIWDTLLSGNMKVLPVKLDPHETDDPLIGLEDGMLDPALTPQAQPRSGVNLKIESTADLARLVALLNAAPIPRDLCAELDCIFDIAVRGVGAMHVIASGANGFAAGLGPPTSNGVPLVQVEFSADDFGAVLQGRADATRLYLSRRVLVRGDLTRAKKFRLIAEHVQRALLSL